MLRNDISRHDLRRSVDDCTWTIRSPPSSASRKSLTSSRGQRDPETPQTLQSTSQTPHAARTFVLKLPWPSAAWCTGIRPTRSLVLLI
ncbi:hypothetical protein V5799_029083 [Amblyomma americanum]|uniref:Uncharacterized protein n=1 Tax=Amblyomma americanum TaxID=6943 RepID=A0AAQ4ES82_AMBAM